MHCFILFTKNTKGYKNVLKCIVLQTFSRISVQAFVISLKKTVWTFRIICSQKNSFELLPQGAGGGVQEQCTLFHTFYEFVLLEDI